MFCCLPLIAAAQFREIKLNKDLTRVKAEGVELTLLNGMIDTNNAHEMATLSVFRPKQDGPALVIPFEIGSAYEPVLMSRRGADCAVRATRVLQRGPQLRVAYAQRKGDWSDKRSATITLFDFHKGMAGLPGTPDVYFKISKTVDTKALYCDMDEALDKEAAVYN